MVCRIKNRLKERREATRPANVSSYDEQARAFNANGAFSFPSFARIPSQ